MEALGADRTSRQYAEDDVGMLFGAVLDPVLSRLAKALVEVWRLKSVRHENDLRAIAMLGLGLGGLKECLAQTPAAKTLVDPEVRDLAANPGYGRHIHRQLLQCRSECFRPSADHPLGRSLSN
jgi:hypothetical protein